MFPCLPAILPVKTSVTHIKLIVPFPIRFVENLFADWTAQETEMLKSSVAQCSAVLPSAAVLDCRLWYGTALLRIFSSSSLFGTADCLAESCYRRPLWFNWLLEDGIRYPLQNSPVGD